jgi:DNA polymerase-3 subunit delta
MLDFALEGKGADAVRELDKLLLSGEHPIQILGAITSSLRKFAAATIMILDAEKQKRTLPVETALKNAGMNPYFIGKGAKGQLIKLGRYRGMKLCKQLLTIDLALKGDSRTAPRILLEKLLLWVANEKLRPTG